MRDERRSLNFIIKLLFPNNAQGHQLVEFFLIDAVHTEEPILENGSELHELGPLFVQVVLVVEDRLLKHQQSVLLVPNKSLLFVALVLDLV